MDSQPAEPLAVGASVAVAGALATRLVPIVRGCGVNNTEKEPPEQNNHPAPTPNTAFFLKAKHARRTISHSGAYYTIRFSPGRCKVKKQDFAQSWFVSNRHVSKINSPCLYTLT